MQCVAPGEGVRGERDDVAVDSCLGHRARRRGHHVRRVAFQFVERGLDGHGEIAAVPEIAVGHVFLGGRAIRFLDEGSHLVDAFRPGQGLARADVAEAGHGLGRGDSEDHDRPGARRRGGDLRRGVEPGGVADQVVGGEHEHDPIARGVSGDPRRRRGDGRGRVTRLGLEEERRLDAGLGKRFVDEEAMLAVGDHDRRFEKRIVGDAGERRGEGRCVAAQGQEGLRHDVVRRRPKTGPGAAGEDDGERCARPLGSLLLAINVQCSIAHGTRQAQRHANHKKIEAARSRARERQTKTIACSGALRSAAAQTMSSRRIRLVVCLSQSRSSATLAVAMASRLSAAP